MSTSAGQLAADGQGRYRLWQIVRIERSLRSQPTLRARRGDLLAELWKISRQNEGQAPSEWRLLQRLAALAKE